MFQSRGFRVNQVARSTCLGCFRPKNVCYCSVCPTIFNRTHVRILQHPREQFHPLGTARIVQRSLHNAEVHVVHRMRLPTATLVPGDGLLFPAPGARRLAEVPSAERPRRLVVLDGTWHQARQLLKSIPQLRSLPAFVLVPREPTRYRIRRPPAPTFVSTLEAILQALELLEPDTPDLGALLLAFERMIDLHLQASGRAIRTPRRRIPKPRQRRHGLPESHTRLVAVYAEAHRPGRVATTAAKQLLQLTGYRWVDGAIFSRLVRPASPPSRGQLERMGIDPGALQAAPERSQVLTEFRSFVGSDPQIVTWNRHSARDLTTLLAVSSCILLKDVYFRLHRKKPGVPASLLSLCRERGDTAEEFSLPGRARERLGAMVALTCGLWRCAYGEASLDPSVAGDTQAEPTRQQRETPEWGDRAEPSQVG